MWHVHPPTLHVFSSKRLYVKAQAQEDTVRSIYDAYSSSGGSGGSGGGGRTSGVGHEISLIDLTNMVVDMDLPSLGLKQEHVAAFVSDEFARVDVRIPRG